jgi:hypothetical protein
MSPFPNEDRPNPYANMTFETGNYRNAILAKTFKGHMMAISSLAMFGILINKGFLSGIRKNQLLLQPLMTSPGKSGHYRRES